MQRTYNDKSIRGFNLDLWETSDKLNVLGLLYRTFEKLPVNEEPHRDTPTTGEVPILLAIKRVVTPTDVSMNSPAELHTHSSTGPLHSVGNPQLAEPPRLKGGNPCAGGIPLQALPPQPN